MATIINSVAFENFYNYYGSYEHNEYKLKPGINIVNADNNMGKSKFYNGFMWLLYDQVYDSDIKAFVNANESLLKMASGKAKAEDNEFKVGIRIIFTNGGTKYTMEKYVFFFHKNAELINEESRLDIIKTINNADTPVLDKEEQKSIINKVFIPLTLRSYALLQGESMDRLVDLSSKKALADTIDTLAGISVLKGICDTSKKMAQKAYALFQKQDSESSKFDLERKRDQEKRNQYKANIERTLSEIENAKDELNAAKRKKEELNAYLSNSNKRIEIRSQLDTIRIQIENQRDLIDRIETSITKKIFDEENPWLLMGLEDELDTFDAKREKHIGDLAQMNNDRALVIMLPEGSPDSSSLERMLKNEICEVCGQPATKHSQAWEHIKLILDRPKKVSTNRNNFGNFYGTLQKSVSSYSRSIPQIESRIEALTDKLEEDKEHLEELEGKREEIFTELNNAGGNADNSAFKDNAIVKDYEVAHTTIATKEREINEKQRMVNMWKSSLDAINQKLSSYKKDMSIQKYEDFADLLQRINDIIVKTKDDIYDRTITALAKEANEKYVALTSGNQSSGGKLVFERNHDVVNVSIRDVRNGEITGLGTGFQRMKQLAIVMAIISSKIGDEKKFDYPFISDAPFSEFGENFINP